MENWFAFYKGVGARCGFDDLTPGVIRSVVVMVIIIVGRGAVCGENEFDKGVGYFFKVEECQPFGVGSFCKCEITYIVFNEVVEYCGGCCFYGHFSYRSSSVGL